MEQNFESNWKIKIYSVLLCWNFDLIVYCLLPNMYVYYFYYLEKKYYFMFYIIIITNSDMTNFSLFNYELLQLIC